MESIGKTEDFTDNDYINITDNINPYPVIEIEQSSYLVKLLKYIHDVCRHEIERLHSSKRTKIEKCSLQYTFLIFCYYILYMFDYSKEEFIGRHIINQLVLCVILDITLIFVGIKRRLLWIVRMTFTFFIQIYIILGVEIVYEILTSLEFIFIIIYSQLLNYWIDSSLKCTGLNIFAICYLCINIEVSILNIYIITPIILTITGIWFKIQNHKIENVANI